MNFAQSCEQLYTITHIPLYLVLADGTCPTGFPATLGRAIKPQYMKLVLTDFELQHRDTLHPLITYIEPGYFLGVLALDDGQYCVTGLVSPFSHSREEILRITAYAIEPEALQEFGDLMMQMPRVTLYQLKALLQLLVQFSHGVQIGEEDILFVDNTIREFYGRKNLDGALFNQREEEEFHIPVNFEQVVCAAIEAGDTEQLDRRLQAPLQGQIGRMSSNPLQQMKYSFVIFAALVTRAAIRGGLTDEVAFSLSDIYCQRADVQQDPSTLDQLNYTMAVDFCNHVAEVRKTAIRSQPVRDCVAYISQHLHENLCLDVLSRECGLCSRSLSIKFKAEIGMGIPEFIHREKLREAKYLLLHTEYTLTQITAYLNYPTQSYFTQIFKRYEGCTPQQYRDDPRCAAKTQVVSATPILSV